MHLASVIRMLAAALLAFLASPSWAIPDSPAVTPNGNGAFVRPDSALQNLVPSFLPQASSSSAQESYLDVIRAIEEPDVAVFPIRVAGPVYAIRRNPADNKLAMDRGSIAVIYPEIAEPYRSVFTQIIQGIEDRVKGRIANIAMTPNINVDQLRDSLQRQNTKVVIALGHQGMKVASALDHGMSVVVGCVLTAPEAEASNVQVNSLSPDPALLFSRLKGLMPGARRVYTVYDPRQNEWMMRLAKEAARTNGLQLVTYQAQDLRSAIQAYQEIFSHADSGKDALWLPQDSTTVEDSTVLPLVLRESWNRNIVVFSSSFGHVRRGVLFSLYPNNVELGRHLAGSALDLLASGENNSGIVPLREVLMAVNLRTARHLEIDVDRQQKFDLAFPMQ